MLRDRSIIVVSIAMLTAKVRNDAMRATVVTVNILGMLEQDHLGKEMKMLQPTALHESRESTS